MLDNQTIEFYIETKFQDRMYLKNPRDFWIYSLTNCKTITDYQRSVLEDAGVKFIQTFKDN